MVIIPPWDVSIISLSLTSEGLNEVWRNPPLPKSLPVWRLVSVLTYSLSVSPVAYEAAETRDATLRWAITQCQDSPNAL